MRLLNSDSAVKVCGIGCNLQLVFITYVPKPTALVYDHVESVRSQDVY
jgi:hypothetical protein